METLTYIAVFVGFTALTGSLALFYFRRKKAILQGPSKAEPTSKREVKETASWTGKFQKTQAFWKEQLHAFTHTPFDDARWSELEEVLLSCDIGPTLSRELVEAAKKDGGDWVKVLRSRCMRIFEGNCESAVSLIAKPHVISVVGVNGAGKTTSVAKIANFLKGQNKNVILGATDTFRAAAVEQLRVWAEQMDLPIVTGKQGADPGAVAYDTVNAAKARGLDVAILDTAGRLHTKANLMEELKKVHRVVAKIIPEAPHDVWLVIDATTGQNAVHQAREFQSALRLTGIIVTKLDGTARGGILMNIVDELKVPVRFAGIGEAVLDLVPFDAHSYIDSILRPLEMAP